MVSKCQMPLQLDSFGIYLLTGSLYHCLAQDGSSNCVDYQLWVRWIQPLPLLEEGRYGETLDIQKKKDDMEYYLTQFRNYPI